MQPYSKSLADHLYLREQLEGVIRYIAGTLNTELTHCWITSTSSALTPILLVPRKCHAVSTGRFWIIIPVKTISSVSTGPRIV